MQAALIPYYPMGSMYIVHEKKPKNLLNWNQICASVDIMNPQDVSLSNIAVILLKGELAVRGNCRLHTSGHAEEQFLSCSYSGESAA